MPNSKSAKKRMRRDQRVRVQNQRHRTRARTELRQAREAIAAGDIDQAQEAVREAVKWLDHAASKGVIHPNNAARRKSRLMKRLAELQAEK